MDLPHPLSGPYGRALAIACEASIQAGSLLRQAFFRPKIPAPPEMKQISEDAEILIFQQLSQQFPHWDFFGAEGGAQRNAKGGEGSPYWLVQSNGGRWAFKYGQRGSTVSIGLIHKGVPVLGVVYAYAPPIGGEDLTCWAEGVGSILRSGVPCPLPSQGRLKRDDVILVSGGADDNAMAYARTLSPARFRSIPSIAYRLALVATGNGAGATSFADPEPCDLAAGHALLRGANLSLLNGNGQHILYGETAQSRHSIGGRCFAGSPEIAKTLYALDWQRLEVKDPTKTQNLSQPKRTLLVNNAGLLERAQGTLLGQLSGDSLGGQVEFWSANDVKSAYPDGVRNMDWGGAWGTLPGQPTDDSELALSLARCLTSIGHYDEEEAARAYIQWKETGPFDIGLTTTQALRAGQAHLEKEGSALAGTRLGASRTSQANGALMRISPLGIFGHTLPEKILGRLARADAAITHPHPVCQAANDVFSKSIAFAIREAPGPLDLYKHTLEHLNRGVEVHPDGYGPLLERILSAESGHVPRGDGPHQGWVLIAFQNAFFQLLHSDSVEEGLVNTINLGGDTDTNGSIAGALLGACYGVKGIPNRWQQHLFSCRPMAGLPDVKYARPPNFWPVDCAQLAEHLLATGMKDAQKV